MDHSPSLSEARKAIEKKFGPSAIMSMGDAPQPIPSISTGSLLVDKITGIGGIPRGRITEIFGGESSGKTTIALQTIAEAQKQGLPCLFIDVEQALDLEYAKKLGVSDDPNLFLFAQPECGEDALEIAREMILTGSIGLVVVDSVAALSPRAELEGDLADALIGAQARLMGRAMRVLSSAINSKTGSKVALLMLNQERANIGVMYGNPNVTPGGRALKFASSLRIGLNQSTRIGKKGEETGHVVRARVVKNKLAPPFRMCEFTINFGKGVSLTGEMVPIGLYAGIWQRKGSWFSIDGENVAQGAEKMQQYLEDLQTSDNGTFTKYLKMCTDYVKGTEWVFEVDEENNIE